MKIAQVDVDYNFSSTGKIVADLVNAFCTLGHQTNAYYGRGINTQGDNIYRVNSKVEVLLHVIGTRISGLTDGFSPFSTYRLIKHFEKFKPDIVHLHELHGYYINIQPVINYLQSRSIPIVWTFHSEFMYTGKCGHAFDCEKWKSECNKCPLLKEYPKSLFLDFTTYMFRNKKAMFSNLNQVHLVAPTEWLANRMRQSIVQDKDISVIYNGIDLDIFYRRDSTKLRKSLGIENEYTVVSIGSDLLSERKGGKWILALAARNPDIVFVMVGVTNVSQKVPNNVRIISRVFDKDVLAEYFSLGNLFMLTSERETFSMVCIESLACGTPVIGFDAGGPSEIVSSGFGEFVPYANLDALEKLLLHARQGEIAFKSSIECEQYVKRYYAKERMVNGYLDIYERMIGKNGSNK